MVRKPSLIVVDFGSQTAHLILRRVKQLGAQGEIIEPDQVLDKIKNDKKPLGIILSGGPDSVYLKNAPTIDPRIFGLNIPILGICYGLQIMAHLLGGKVIPGKKEYGPAQIQLKQANGLPEKFTVWMSHGDEVVKLPKGFEVLGSTDHVVNAFVANQKQKIWGVQFHPEVEHTDHGTTLLKSFLVECGVTFEKKSFDVSVIRQEIKKQAGGYYVIGAVSGGVDSTVAGILAADALKEKFIPIYVENGLMRERTKEHVEQIFLHHKVKPIVCNVEKEMLRKLKGVSDPEKKRKIIGAFYIEVFEREMIKQIQEGKNVRFLLQGTIYSDVIESKGSKHASKIKSHHNVGGLPKNMKLKLIEPLRNFYKDEVRNIGKLLGLSKEFVNKQVFPGPGYAVRIRGEVTKERLIKEKLADKIVLEELEKASYLSKVYMSFPIMTGAYSTAVKGDGRFFGEVVALRIVESKDVMTSKWAQVPYQILQKISTRLVNEVEGISRVVYDITTKPPATMEWE
ncbi:glutamine-hydrolyzing GMP synthase [Candidatus Daviesbacteria bacterium]|nr:glutamine-hydrolyzing GMP synthase [Candidatus Daviesbacteria bacterium]